MIEKVKEVVDQPDLKEDLITLLREIFVKKLNEKKLLNSGKRRRNNYFDLLVNDGVKKEMLKLWMEENLEARKEKHSIS